VAFDNIDEYANGPVQFTTTNLSEFLAADQDNTTVPWAGADNPNKFYTPSDFFDRTKTQFGINPLVPGFTDRLGIGGTNVAVNGLKPTYDRYTFYRMLSQLGTDSAVDFSLMNLNYDNLDSSGRVVPGAETNLIGWTPLRFFTNAADRLLKVYTTNWYQAGPSNYLYTYYNYHQLNPIDRYTGYGLSDINLG